MLLYIYLKVKMNINKRLIYHYSTLSLNLFYTSNTSNKIKTNDLMKSLNNFNNIHLLLKEYPHKTMGNSSDKEIIQYDEMLFDI